MTDKRENEQAEPVAVMTAPQPAPAAISRRLLIRGAYVAVPTILTLNSKTAAAWAVASGTIAAAPRTGGDALCMYGDFPPEPGPKTGQYLLPDNPSVIEISSDYEYKLRPSGGGGYGSSISAEDVCEFGGQDLKYRLKNTNNDFVLVEGHLDAGVLVSSSAAASFGVVGRIPQDFF